MATKTLVTCDWADVKTGKACGKDVTEEGGTISFTTENRRMAADLCSEHLRVLRPHAHVASPPLDRSNVTKLPRAGAGTRKPQEQLISDPTDMKECRRWLEFMGDLKQNSRGRIAQHLQQKFLDAGSPREVADGTFKPST